MACASVKGYPYLGGCYGLSCPSGPVCLGTSYVWTPLSKAVLLATFAVVGQITEAEAVHPLR
jgi:hypothetical protein